MNPALDLPRSSMAQTETVEQGASQNTISQ